MNTDVIKRFIIEDLLPNIWGGKHKEIRNMIRGLPHHLSSSKKGKKLINKALQELLNVGWIKIERKRSGKTSSPHISLKPNKKKEIMQFIMKN